MSNNKTFKILTYINCFHSWEGSNMVPLPDEIKRSMSYCRHRVKTICGLDIHAIPADMEAAILFLNNHFKHIDHE